MSRNEKNLEILTEKLLQIIQAFKFHTQVKEDQNI